MRGNSSCFTAAPARPRLASPETPLLPTWLRTCTQSRVSGITEKISAYKAESKIGQADDHPLLWWKANECRFKSLAVIARKWLCLQASSVSAERLFSSAGEVVSRKRASLAPDNVDMLLFFTRICSFCTFLLTLVECITSFVVIDGSCCLL